MNQLSVSTSKEIHDKRNNKTNAPKVKKKNVQLRQEERIDFPKKIYLKPIIPPVKSGNNYKRNRFIK